MPTEQSITSTALTRNDSMQPRPDTSLPPDTIADRSSHPDELPAVVTTRSALPENQPGFVWSNVRAQEPHPRPQERLMQMYRNRSDGLQWDQGFVYHSPVEQIPSNWFLAGEFAKMQLRFAQMAALYEICYPDTKEDLERAMHELDYEMSRLIGYCRDMMLLRRATLGEGRNFVEGPPRRICTGLRRRERDERQARESWA